MRGIKFLGKSRSTKRTACRLTSIIENRIFFSAALRGEVEFVQIANFKKDLKTCVKLMILSFLRRPTHQYIQFYTGFVSFFDIVNFHKIDFLLVASN